MTASPRRLALATCAAYPELTDDDIDLVRLLESHGWQTAAAVWNDADVDWSRFGGVLIRSCWDYHLDGRAFGLWLDRLDGLAIPVQNPTPVLRSNMDKRYLRTLADVGIPIIPTCFVDPCAPVPDLAAWMGQRGWDEAVIKPAISGGAHRTWRVTANDATAYQADLAETAATTGALIQAFAPEILTEGEWSLIYIGGRYSHAVVKRPRPGDFRVQDLHGGTVTAEKPPGALLAHADAIVQAAFPSLPYVRVDGIERAGGLCLMEVELIEPNLFLRWSPPAAARLAAAVTAALERA